MTQAIELLTPVGRMVQGDLFKGRTTDNKGKPLLVKNGPNAGQPRTEYFVAIAIAKTDPGWADLWSKICQAAQAGYPQFFNAQGQCTNQFFSMKYTDGDSTEPNRVGKKPCDREGFPGNHILNFSSGFPIMVYGTGGKSEITDPSTIKRGYYIRIAGNVRDNAPSETPGVYLNIGGVEFIAYGEEIKTGPDGAAMFGNAPAPVLPPGASATPLNPQTTPAGMLPSNPQMTSPAGVVSPSTAPVVPVPSFVPASMTNDQKYLIGGQIYTRAQLIQFGWTPDQIMMAQTV